MNTKTKTAPTSDQINALTAKAARADLLDIAVTVFGMEAKAASKYGVSDLVEKMGRDGFTEDGLLMALVDDFGFHPIGVNELCLSSMIALWLECIAPAKVVAAKPAAKPARKVAATKTKTSKPADFPTAAQLFGQKETAVISAKTASRRAAREQDMREVGAWQHKYAKPGQGPRDIIFAMIQAGQFTKRQIRAAVLEAFPAIKSNYLNTQMARTTNPKSPAFKQLAVANAETGIVTWA